MQGNDLLSARALGEAVPGRGRRARSLSAEVKKHYQALLSSLAWPGASGGTLLRSVGLTSCRRREGVSSVAAQLAVTAASCSDQRVLLVDTNLAHPTLHRTFGVPADPGLAELLRNPAKLSVFAQDSGAARLSLLTAGRRSAATLRAFESADLSDALEAFKTNFDLVVFDLPSGLHETPALRLANLLDGVLLVVEAEAIRWETARRYRDVLARANVTLLGAVLNKRRYISSVW